MGYSENTYLFYGARLTEEQHDVACEQGYQHGIECLGLGDCTGHDAKMFLAVGIREVTIDHEPVAFDAPPRLSPERLRALRIALEDLGVKEEPRWWLGVSGG